MSTPSSSDLGLKLILPSNLRTEDGRALDIVIEKKVNGRSIKLSVKDDEIKKIQSLVEECYKAVAEQAKSSGSSTLSPTDVTFTWTKLKGQKSETNVILAGKVSKVAIPLLKEATLQSDKGKPLTTVRQSMRELAKLLRTTKVQSSVSATKVAGATPSHPQKTTRAATISVSTHPVPVPVVAEADKRSPSLSEIELDFGILDEVEQYEGIAQARNDFGNKLTNLERYPGMEAVLRAFGRDERSPADALVYDFIREIESCILQSPQFKEEMEELDESEEQQQKIHAREKALDYVLRLIYSRTWKEELSDERLKEMVDVREAIKNRYLHYQKPPESSVPVDEAEKKGDEDKFNELAPKLTPPPILEVLVAKPEDVAPPPVSAEEEGLQRLRQSWNSMQVAEQGLAQQIKEISDLAEKTKDNVHYGNHKIIELITDIKHLIEEAEYNSKQVDEYLGTFGKLYEKDQRMLTLIDLKKNRQEKAKQDLSRALEILNKNLNRAQGLENERKAVKKMGKQRTGKVSSRRGSRKK